jgi:hypothetical protein
LRQRYATCHSDRPYWSRGLCKSCCDRNWNKGHRAANCAQKAAVRAAHPGRDAREHLNWRQRNPEAYLLSKARQRAKQKGLPCTITVSDIHIPETCPVLGIKLQRSFGGNRYGPKATDASPSLDRIKPSLGYIPGNVAVISFRANMVKSFGTAEEHRKIAAWLQSLQVDQPI